MRRLILAEALTHSALHFYCGGTSLLVDGFLPETGAPDALPPETSGAILRGEGKYRGLALSLSTAPRGQDPRPVLEERRGFPSGESCVTRGPFRVEPVEYPSGTAFYITVDSLSILLLGKGGGDTLPDFSEPFPRAEILFLPEERFWGRSGLPLALSCGARSVFVTGAGERDGGLTHKRVKRFQKKGCAVRILDETPSGWIL